MSPPAVLRCGVASDGFLGELAPDELARLRALGVERRAGAGSRLFHEGEHSTVVFALTSGHVKVVRTSQDGRETVLGFRGPGDLLGEVGVVTGRARSATALALTAVTALAVPAPAFLDFLRSAPQAGFALVRMLSTRLADADTARAEYGGSDVGARLARRLLELAGPDPGAVADGVRLGLPLTQEELAAWIGCSREAVARALAELRRDGVVRSGRQAIWVLDVEELRRRAQ